MTDHLTPLGHWAGGGHGLGEVWPGQPAVGTQAVLLSHTGEQDCCWHEIPCRCALRIIHLRFWMTQWEAVTCKCAKPVSPAAGEHWGEGSWSALAGAPWYTTCESLVAHPSMTIVCGFFLNSLFIALPLPQIVVTQCSSNRE